MKFGSESGIPKTSLRLSDSLERSPDSEKLLNSHFWFIITKRYELRSAKEKGVWGKF